MLVPADARGAEIWVIAVTGIVVWAKLRLSLRKRRELLLTNGSLQPCIQNKHQQIIIAGADNNVNLFFNFNLSVKMLRKYTNATQVF